ncbi:MAG: AAA family ATPase [Actinobacteria bacterium]|nr:AAA family ATPase [Actinomycetota bacterium]
MTRVVLVAPDSRLERLVQLVVAEELVVIPATDPEQFSGRLARMAERPELIVFGHQLPRHLALALASAGRQHADGMAMVSDEPGIVIDAMRAGISDVLPTDVDLDAIQVMVARAHEFSLDAANVARPAPSLRRLGPGRTIAVTSPKGGVGKTTVACNLAVGLALQQPGCVVLVDLDLQFGDVASTLGLQPTYFLEHALAKGAARDSVVLTTVLTRHHAGLLVLAAPESPATADGVTPAQIGHLLRQLADQYLYVIVDTSPGLLEHTLTALEEATDVVAVTSMDVSSVRGTRKQLDLLDELGLLPGSRQVVVNLGDRASGLTVRDIENALDVRVDLVVPRTRGAAVAGNTGETVMIASPRDRAARAFRRLVGRLWSEQPRIDLTATEPIKKVRVS